MFLTVNLIDRFLERHEVARKNLQLVGVTSMLLACKYEEVFVPSVDEFVMITDKAYTRKEVLNMVHILYLLMASALLHVLNTFNSLRYLSLNLFLFFFPVPLGENNGECVTIQHVYTNPVRFHEKIPQGSSN